MHPKVLQQGPGNCPFCGMVLESLLPSSDHSEESDEYQDLKCRFWVSVFFVLPIVFLSMAPMVLNMIGFQKFGEIIMMPWALWVQFILTLPLLFWSGWPIWQRGWNSFRSGSLNMFSLISIGMGVTFFYSSGVLFSQGMSFLVMGQEHPGVSDLYFEAAAMIMVLVLLGQLLESQGRRKASRALRELLELVPNKATLLREGKEREVSVSELQSGDIIRIHPGEKIPVDGIIIEGSSAVDEAMLTGEAFPVEKSLGSQVTAGTLNSYGSFVMRVEKVGRETVLAQMIEMVAAAQRSRAPIQSLADHVSAILVPLILVIAVVTFVVWILLKPELGYSFALARSVAVLMITCPCALGLATPMAVAVGVGRAAHYGILIREAGALQQLASASIMAFDKTGTLTEGKPEVVAIRTFSEISEEQLLQFLAAAERGSEHPLAKAILRYTQKRKIAEQNASTFLAEPGGGVSATIDGKSVLVGSIAFLARHGVNTTAIASEVLIKDHGMIAIALNNQLTGVVMVSDSIKDSAKGLLKKLQQLGIEIAMLTGDSAFVAESIARELGINLWKAGLSPAQKAEQITQWKEEGKIVAMAGDGINDAHAFSVADASIAMNGGSNIAKEIAGIILMHSSLEGIVTATLLSRAILKTIRQNLFFAFAYNLLGVPIAAGILYPWFGILLSPMLATAAMSLSSLSVIGNSLRLANYQRHFISAK